MTDYTDRLEQLEEFIDANEFDKIIFDCQSLLLNNNEDNLPDNLQRLLLELQAKSYVQQEQWQQVIDLFNVNNKKEKEESLLLQPLAAYAYYRLGDYVKAKDLSDNNCNCNCNCNCNDELSSRILAQSLYRLHETDQAWQKYKEIASSVLLLHDEEEETMQILTNALAVRNANAPIASPYQEDDDLVQQAEAFLQKTTTTTTTTTTTGDLYYYDLAYNLGTYQVWNNNKDTAAAAEGRANLQNAEHAIIDQMEDGDARRKELLPIQINLQWSIIKKQGGGGVQSVGTDFVSKLNAGKTLALKDLPPNATLIQKRLFHYNQAILALKTKQFPLLKLNCSLLLKNLKKITNNKYEVEWWKSRVAVLEALSLEQQGKLKDAKKHLQQAVLLFESDICTAWIQLHLAKLDGKLNSAIDKLEILQNLPTRIADSRAVLATRAALHQELGQEQLPADLLNEQDAADLLLLQEKYDQAAPYFATKTDEKSRAKYALCLSYTDTDPQKAMQLWNDLGIIEDAPSTELNGDELEQLPLPRVKASSRSITLPVASSSSSSKRSHDSVLKRRTKEREKHLASLQLRGLDTTSRGAPPDRWIPKYERSKNRKRGQHKGAQGGFTEKDAAKYDVAARQADGYIPHNKNSTAHMSVAGDGSSSQRKGGRRKK